MTTRNAPSPTASILRPRGAILSGSIAELERGSLSQRDRRFSMGQRSLRTGWAIASLLAALVSTGSAGTVSVSLTGNTEVNLWGAGSLTAAANPGYGGFPGTGAWPAPIQSPVGGDAYLRKIDNQNNAAIGTGGGGPFPSGSTIYFGGFGGTPNTDGGTLGVADAAPVLNLQTVAFQIEIGQAYGYDLLNNDLSLVTLSYTTASGGSGTLTSDFSSRLNRVYNSSVDMPTGPGGIMQPEDIYVNLWGLQWDLSNITGITSFEIQFTGVEHAQLWQLRLDQSSAAYAQSAFPQDALWTAGGADAKWSTAANWQGGTVSTAGQNVTLNGGAGAVLDSNQAVGSLTLDAADGFVLSSSGGSVLTVASGINGTAASAANYTISAPVHMSDYNLIDLNENSHLTVAGPITGNGFYKQGLGSLSLTGNNVFNGDNAQLAANGLIIRGGTNYISGTNTLTGTGNVALNIRQDTTVVLHGGDNRLDAKFVVNLMAGSSKLVLGNGSGKSDLTIAGISGVAGSQAVGGSATVSTLTAAVPSGSREFVGNLGGPGLNENNLALTKKGAGTQILSGVNTHAGATRIEGGLLQIGSATALSANSNVQMAGGVLGLGAANYSGTLGSGAGQIQFLGDGGFAAHGAPRTVELNGGQALAWGSGGFVGQGSRLILSHSATDNTVDFVNAIDLGNQARAVQVDNGSASIDARLSGVLSGAGGLVKTGAGTVELAAANTSTGGTFIREGNLTLAGASGSLKGDVTAATGTTLQLTNTAAANNTNRLEDTAKVTLHGAILNFSNATAGTTPAYGESIGELALKNGANVIATTRVASGNTAELNIGTLTRAKGATVNFTGTSVGLDARNKITVNTSLTSASNGFIGGWATAGNGFASYGGNGIWAPSTTSSFYTTTAESTWTGSDMNVSVGFAAAAPLNLTTHRTINSILAQGGTTGGGKLWNLNGYTLTVQSGGIITYTGNSSNTTKFNNGTLTAGTGGNAELFVTANTNTDIGAVIANNGAGQVALVKAGSSTLTLTGTNGYSGGTYVNQGTLNVNGANLGGGSLEVRKGAFLNVNGSMLVNGAFVADGTIGGAGALTYGAGTTLSGGGSLSQAVTVGSGVGQVSAIAPGNSVGLLTTGSETWAGGGSYLWEIKDVDAGLGLGWDSLNINGTLNISASEAAPFTIQIASLNAADFSGLVGDFNGGQQYSWIIATASGGITGFDASDFVIDTGGFMNDPGSSGAFSVRVQGNNVELTYAVPEPSSALLLGGTALWLLGCRCRRPVSRA